MIFFVVFTKWVHEGFIEKLLQRQSLSLSYCFKSNFDSMQTLIDLLEFTSLVTSSGTTTFSVAELKKPKPKVHIMNVESTDPVQLGTVALR